MNPRKVRRETSMVNVKKTRVPDRRTSYETRRVETRS